MAFNNKKNVRLAQELKEASGSNGITQTASEIRKNEALEFPQPSNVKKLRRFLGLTKWFKLYIKGYAIVTRSLTDASNSGLGAALLQQDAEGRWVPIQWASKKLTRTEERYGITEKEMLAVF